VCTRNKSGFIALFISTVRCGVHRCSYSTSPNLDEAYLTALFNLELYYAALVGLGLLKIPQYQADEVGADIGASFFAYFL